MNTRRQFFYCPVCGGKFLKKPSRPLRCAKCGFDFFSDPSVSVAGIITNKKGQILMVKRGKGTVKAGLWTIPGGFIDLDETGEDALKREAKEEAGVTIKTPTYFGSYIGTYRYQNINYRIVNFVFIAEMKKIEFKKNDEMVEHAFFDIKNIPFGQIAFSGVRQALKEYAKKKPA